MSTYDCRSNPPCIKPKPLSLSPEKKCFNGLVPVALSLGVEITCISLELSVSPSTQGHLLHVAALPLLLLTRELLLTMCLIAYEYADDLVSSKLMLVS